MNDRKKNAIRAVITAFLFLALVVVMARGRTRPLSMMLGYGDFRFETYRPLALEQSLFSTDLVKLRQNSQDGKKHLQAWNNERDYLKNILGSAYEWIGWGPWRVAVAAGHDSPPMIAVGAGYLASIGPGLVRASGFEVSDPIESYETLQKEDLVFVQVKDLWIIGQREAVATVIKHFDNPSIPAWWKLPLRLADSADSTVVISPDTLRKLFIPGDITPASEAALMEWIDFEDWSGALASVNLKRKSIQVKVWIALPKDIPLARLWGQLGSGATAIDWLHPDMTFGARVAINDPADLREKVKSFYAKRPVPNKTIAQIEEELRRELNINAADLLDGIQQDMGFIKIARNGSENIVLFAGATPGKSKKLREMENVITEGWQAGFEVIPIRFIPRLLAYGIDRGKLIVASSPQVLGAYADGMAKTGDVPRAVKKAAKTLSSSPLVLAGRIPGAKDPSSNKTAGWYVAGINYSRGRLEAEMIAPVHFEEQPRIPWKPRLLGWGVTIARVVGWILAAVLLGIFLSSALSLNRNKHSAELPESS